MTIAELYVRIAFRKSPECDIHELAMLTVGGDIVMKPVQGHGS